MNARVLSTWHRAAMSAAALALAAVPAHGHITIDGPNGGEVFEVGEVVTITWHITIEHTLLNWDLAYSHVNPGCAAGARSCLGVGPWNLVALNLPAGDPSVGSVHTYDWTIPQDAAADAVWIRVYMDNVATDYTDFNDERFSIVPPPCPWDCDSGESFDGNVGIVDFLTLLAQWGGPGTCDFDGGGVGITDFLELLANWGPCP